MFKVIILVCSIGMEHSACNPHSANNIYHAQDVNSPMACMMMAQTTMATAPGEGVLNYDSSKEYVKVTCVRDDTVVQRPSRDALVSKGR